MAPPPSTARYGLLAPYGLHWFRRDLRVAGNPALGWSAAEHGGRVLGLFCFFAGAYRIGTEFVNRLRR